MEAIFKTWMTGRELYSNFFDDHSLEQLNKIPIGHNNNLIWNIGHIIVAQQSLIYKGSDLKMYIPEEMVALYKPGTRPTGEMSQVEADELKELLISLVSKTKDDLQKGMFATYIERRTATGFYLSSIQDAFEFNNYHEGLHLGYMMSIRKFI